MVYGHTVKKNGILYKAGEDVPDTTQFAVEKDNVDEEPRQTVRRGRPPKNER